MDKVYKKIIEQMVISGKRIRVKSGKIQDIGITKQNLTEEDIRIERELKNIVNGFNPKHEFYAEEENSNFLDAKDVWVVDPISGTHVFICGLPHYGIVISHIHNSEVQFAAVYDPAMDDLYVAYKNKGAYLNGERMYINNNEIENPRIIFNLSIVWKDIEVSRKIFYELSKFELYRVLGSHTVNDGLVACGKYNGVVCLAKDSFPYFASSLIIQEAGGIFTNINGDKNIKSSDRIFIGGDKKTYRKLMDIVKGVVK
ncbi:MAG: inositol monophosphatase family protein [bacterium]